MTVVLEAGLHLIMVENSNVRNVSLRSVASVR